MSIQDTKAKGKKYSELTKRNTLHHHLGMIGYAARGRSGGRRKGRQLQPGRRICWKVLTRGDVTSSMPIDRKS
jgi:hypothetical protein